MCNIAKKIYNGGRLKNPSTINKLGKGRHCRGKKEAEN